MSETLSIERDALELMLVAAYRRGSEWHRINGMEIGYIAKASNDYADKTMTVAFGPPVGINQSRGVTDPIKGMEGAGHSLNGKQVEPTPE